MVAVDLTPWRKAAPSSIEHWLRDWAPVSQIMRHECSGLSREERGSNPYLHGAAASVTDEGVRARRDHGFRWVWRIWTPIGHVWPYRGGRAQTAAEAMAGADEALARLAEELGAEVLQ